MTRKRGRIIFAKNASPSSHAPFDAATHIILSQGNHYNSLIPINSINFTIETLFLFQIGTCNLTLASSGTKIILIALEGIGRELLGPYHSLLSYYWMKGIRPHVEKLMTIHSKCPRDSTGAQHLVINPYSFPGGPSKDPIWGIPECPFGSVPRNEGS